ncbi:TPA: Transcription factor [Trebouxia sp. C0005]
MNLPRSPDGWQIPASEPAGPVPIAESQQAGPSSMPPALASTLVLTPSPDLASLAQSIAAPESLHSGSGDTGIDRGRGSGTSWGRSSDERRQGEASQSEQGEGASDTKSRRLGQNRVAARKSRQRRKEYVEHLEEEVRTLRADLKRERQGRGAPASPATQAGPSVSPVPVRASVEPPTFSQWVPSSIPNPFQMTGEQGPSQPVGSPALGPVAEGSSAGPYRIMLPMAQTPSNTTSNGVLHAFERWHAQHTVSVRALLEVRNQGSLAGALAQRLANVVDHLLDFFRLKAAVLQGNEAHLVLSLQHLPQGQRRFAPLGVLSCSDICAGLLWKLGPSLEPHQRNFLEQYKTVVMSQEAALHVVLSGAIADMTQVVACVRVPLGLPPPPPIPLTTPDTQAKLQLMCDVFMAADRVWAEFLQHAEQHLSVPQFVTVVSAMAETGAALEEVCHSQAPT